MRAARMPAEARAKATATAKGAKKPAPLLRAPGPVAGVDEAGRGPVLGPLVVAGVLVESEKALAKLGVKDSKKLAPAKREALAAEIRSVATEVVVRVVEPAEIDLQMSEKRLSEVAWFAEVLAALAPRDAALRAGAWAALPATEARLDAADVNAERFGAHVRAACGTAWTVVAQHKADDRYPCVSAASIVAKVERDRAIAEIAREHGADVGSGYSHDERTRAWLAGYVREHGKLPPCARTYWETSQRLVPRKERTLIQFEGT